MKKLVLTSIVIILMQTQVYSQLKNYNDCGKVKILSEKTELTIEGISSNIKPDQTIVGVTVAAALGLILPPAIDYVMASIKEKTKKNALAYKGEYQCSGSGENFYLSKNCASLPKLTITRLIKNVKKSDKVAAEFRLIPELSNDKSAFRYYVDANFVYNYSIAKTKCRYDYIDLILEITFKSISINKLEYKISDLRTTTISIPEIYVGKTKSLSNRYYSGWIPLAPKPIIDTTLKSDSTKEDKIVLKTNNSGITEKSKEETIVIKYNVKDTTIIDNNTGLYEVSIKATETNPYKIKAENKQEIIESTSDSLIEALKAIIKTLTTEEEKEKE